MTVGSRDELQVSEMRLGDMTWVDAPVEGRVLVQSSAHGLVAEATLMGSTVVFDEPRSAVAPGQSVVLYRGEDVLGGGIAV